MRRLANVATPAAAVALPPLSRPPLGLTAIATVTPAVNPVAVLPSESRAVTTTGGLIAMPAVVALGWVVNASSIAGAAVMLNAALVAPVSVPLAAVSVYPVPVLRMRRLVKLASPALALAVSVPVSVAPVGLLPSAAVT